jgi:aspartate dehydrogenase
VDLRVGVIGVGQIGGIVCRALIAGRIPGVRLEAISDRPGIEENLKGLAASAGCGWTVDPMDLAGQGLDLIVESAGAAAARAYAVPVLEGGSDLLIMSLGVLADPDFRDVMIAAAERSNRRILLPSGAIAGLDAVRAASEDALEEVTITTTKGPASLEGAPYLREHGIDLGSAIGPTVVFDGSAQEAIAGFPANVNVAVALGLAAGALDRVRVRIIVDPDAKSTVHRVAVRGAFGIMESTVSNVPLKENPRTSYLAALGALAAVRAYASRLQFS